MALITKSVKLSKGDIEFCLSKGRNLSDGIRRCIEQAKVKTEFIDEIKKLLYLTGTQSQEKELALSVEEKNKLFKLIDE